MRQYLTVGEAETLLRKLMPKIQRVMTLNKALDVLDEVDVEYDETDMDYLTNIRVNKQRHKLYYELYSLLEEVEEKGCMITDVDAGCVDFASLHEGREIMLCWQLGEERISHWHEVGDDFEDRKPIDELMKSSKR